MHKKYKNIIFDLFDTLVKTDFRNSGVQILGKDAHLEPVFKKFSKTEVFAGYKKGLVNYKQLEAALPVEFSPELLKKMLNGLPNYAQPITEMVNLLSIIKNRGYKLYLLTNCRPESFYNFEERFEFMKLFDGMMPSFEAKACKPESKIYLELLKKYNLDPSDCFFIDDEEDRIVGGQKLGIDGAVYIDYESLYLELVANGIL